MADLDLFKRINDTFGHDAGDEVLRRFAGSLRAAVRGSDVAGRIGGEEFAVMLPETPIGGAEEIARRIVTACRGLDISTRRVTSHFRAVSEWPTPPRTMPPSKRYCDAPTRPSTTPSEADGTVGGPGGNAAGHPGLIPAAQRRDTCSPALRTC